MEIKAKFRGMFNNYPVTTIATFHLIIASIIKLLSTLGLKGG